MPCPSLSPAVWESEQLRRHADALHSDHDITDLVDALQDGSRTLELNMGVQPSEDPHD